MYVLVWEVNILAAIDNTLILCMYTAVKPTIINQLELSDSIGMKGNRESMDVGRVSSKAKRTWNE